MDWSGGQLWHGCGLSEVDFGRRRTGRRCWQARHGWCSYVDCAVGVLTWTQKPVGLPGLRRGGSRDWSVGQLRRPYEGCGLRPGDRIGT